MIARMPCHHITSGFRSGRGGRHFSASAGGMNPAAMTLTAVVMDLQDHGKERQLEVERPLTRYFR